MTFHLEWPSRVISWSRKWKLPKAAKPLLIDHMRLQKKLFPIVELERVWPWMTLMGSFQDHESENRPYWINRHLYNLWGPIVKNFPHSQVGQTPRGCKGITKINKTHGTSCHYGTASGVILNMHRFDACLILHLRQHHSHSWCRASYLFLWYLCNCNLHTNASVVALF